MNAEAEMFRRLLAFLASAVFIAWMDPSPVRAQQINFAEFRPHFLELCDRAVAKIADPDSKEPYFVDSYAVRALCAAYDLTGNPKYLDACRQWSERMVGYQKQMIPSSAYYMNYNRKPRETSGDWYSADSSSIGMGVLATAVRCSATERRRFLDSVKSFADLVIDNYIKPSGGVSDGLWRKSSDEWWCSSGTFGSLTFLLYKESGDERYLRAGLGVVDWLNGWDLTKPQPLPLASQGPSMLMYTMECYSSGWPYIIKDQARKKAAMAKVDWYFNWITEQQAKPLADRRWPVTKGWGMKFGGLPFHEYVFSRYLPEDKPLVTNGDEEMRRLEAVVFGGTPDLTQLPMFMLMSYAERLDPGAIYREDGPNTSP